jgi:hypothetical protein
VALGDDLFCDELPESLHPAPREVLLKPRLDSPEDEGLEGVATQVVRCARPAAPGPPGSAYIKVGADLRTVGPLSPSVARMALDLRATGLALHQAGEEEGRGPAPAPAEVVLRSTVVRAPALRPLEHGAGDQGLVSARYDDPVLLSVMFRSLAMSFWDFVPDSASRTASTLYSRVNRRRLPTTHLPLARLPAYLGVRQTGARPVGTWGPDPILQLRPRYLRCDPPPMEVDLVGGRGAFSRTGGARPAALRTLAEARRRPKDGYGSNGTHQSQGDKNCV